MFVESLVGIRLMRVLFVCLALITHQDVSQKVTEQRYYFQNKSLMKTS